MNGGRIAARLGPFVEDGLDIARVEAIRPVAELAGDGHRTLLLEHVADLVRAQRAQQAGHPALAAPALELHGRAAEQPHVVGREAAAEQLFHWTSQQILGAQAARCRARSAPRSRASANRRRPHPPAASAPAPRRLARRPPPAARGWAAAPSGQSRPPASLPANRRSRARCPGSACSARPPPPSRRNGPHCPRGGERRPRGRRRPLSLPAPRLPLRRSAQRRADGNRACTARRAGSPRHCPAAAASADHGTSTWRRAAPRRQRPARGAREPAADSRDGRAARARRLPGAPSARGPVGSRR